MAVYCKICVWLTGQLSVKKRNCERQKTNINFVVECCVLNRVPKLKINWLCCQDFKMCVLQFWCFNRLLYCIVPVEPSQLGAIMNGQTDFYPRVRHSSNTACTSWCFVTFLYIWHWDWLWHSTTCIRVSVQRTMCFIGGKGGGEAD